MLEIAYIRQNRKMLLHRLAVKHFDAKAKLITKYLYLDEKKRSIQTNLMMCWHSLIKLLKK